MRRYLILLVAVVMLFTLSACGNKTSATAENTNNKEAEIEAQEGSSVLTEDNSSENEDDITEVSVIYTDNNVKETVKKTETSTVYDGPDDGTALELVESDYFTVEVPDGWKGIYTYEKVKKNDGTFYLSLYELEEHNSSGAGNLFTIALFPEDTDYSYLPYYEEYGVLTGNGKTYNIIIMYPTDVQFTSNTSDNYNSMYENIKYVLDSMKGVEGFTITKQ